MINTQNKHFTHNSFACIIPVNTANEKHKRFADGGFIHENKQEFDSYD
jgi:hypothetical protein